MSSKSMMFYTSAVLFVLCCAEFANAQQKAKSDKWRCTATSPISRYQYDGGDTAFIHLEVAGPSGGHWYSVTKSGNKASGRTNNGTKFTCTRG